MLTSNGLRPKKAVWEEYTPLSREMPDPASLNHGSSAGMSSRHEGEHRPPVPLHVDNGPAFGRRLIPCLVEPADVGLPVVGPLASGIGVVDNPHEAGAAARRRPLQHLE